MAISEARGLRRHQSIDLQSLIREEMRPSMGISEFLLFLLLVLLLLLLLLLVWI